MSERPDVDRVLAMIDGATGAGEPTEMPDAMRWVPAEARDGVTPNPDYGWETDLGRPAEWLCQDVSRAGEVRDSQRRVAHAFGVDPSILGLDREDTPLLPAWLHIDPPVLSEDGRTFTMHTRITPEGLTAIRDAVRRFADGMSRFAEAVADAGRALDRLLARCDADRAATLAHRPRDHRPAGLGRQTPPMWAVPPGLSRGEISARIVREGHTAQRLPRSGPRR